MAEVIDMNENEKMEDSMSRTEFEEKAEDGTLSEGREEAFGQAGQGGEAQAEGGTLSEGQETVSQQVQGIQGAESVSGDKAPKAASGGAALEKGTAETKAAEKKPKGGNLKRRAFACLEILASVLLAVLGGWMYYHTRGVRLLYVSVAFGRICKYYWIPFIGALVFFAVGFYTLKRLRKEVKKDGKLE